MLKELIIENFVLIDRAEVVFAPGFTVVTGDTGAGKSLLIKALTMLMGARADSRVVGKSGKKAIIQAVFDAGDSVREILDEQGIECEGELILRRIISRDGKNRVFINGVITTLSDLRQISVLLLSLAGQHEFQRLLSVDIHRKWLDEFAGIGTEKFSLLLKEFRRLKRELNTLYEKKASLDARREDLLHDARVIDEIAPEPQEEDTLIEERRLLRHTEKVRGLAQELFQRLYGERGNVLEGLSSCRKLVERLSSIDPGLQKLCSQVDSIIVEADDVASSIRDYLYNLPMDDSRLRQVEERLFELKRLRKRFGPSLEDVLEYRGRIQEELAGMDSLEEKIEEKKGLLEEKGRALLKEAKEISKRRRETARLFQEAVQNQLRDLNLKRARFQVEVTSPSEPSVEDIGATGMDKVSFLFSANPGQELKPLTEVASGGELSRVLLAIKVVMGKGRGSEILIFDEIDSGLGGEVAEKVGRKLRAISEISQVIAISHFPQIAALAHSHVVVKKEQGQSYTVSRVFQVEGKERVEEIARMLGGESGKAREYAKELLGPVFRGA